MDIRSKIILYAGLVAISDVLVGGVAFWANREAGYQLERLQWSHTQHGAIMNLAVATGRYSEQMLQVLVLGDETASGFGPARANALAALAELGEITAGEYAFIRSVDEREVEAEETRRFMRMRSMFNTIDGAVNLMMSLHGQGRTDEAVAFYRSQIRRPLSQSFHFILAEALLDERAEVVELEAATTETIIRLRSVVTVAAIVALGFVALGGMLLFRMLSRPVRQLGLGAAAFERGEFGHRIDLPGDDELARLAERFNSMAEELHRQHHSLLMAQATLEAQVRDRTERLVEANQRLEALDRARLLFLADISHELRTPLTVLRGEAEVTLRGRAPQAEDYRDALQRILRQVEQMGALVDDLLFLARAETDAVRFDRRRTDLRDVADDALEDAHVLAAPRGIIVAAELPEEAITAEVDPARLKQALMIGLANAIKFSSPSGTVTCAMRSHAGEAELSIANTGLAIPPAELPFVFERFYRARQAPGVPMPDGTGLGLPIAKWIIEKLGGRIELTSIPDGQTVLTIRLPQVT